MPINISDATVRSVLASDNPHQRSARKVPYLNTRHRMLRKQWALKYKSFNTRNWTKPIWSDECYIYIGDTRGRIYVSRRPDEEYNENCLVPTFKQSSLQVMIWGCISKGKKGPLIVLEYPGGKGGGMNTDRYISQVLEGPVTHFFAEMKRLRRGPIFMQDGAASHRSKCTLKWFKDNSIPLMDHPPQSPDLNHIEPVWHELKRIVRARTHAPSTISELIQAVKDAWDQLEIKDIDKYIDGMPKQVQAVLDADGGHTKY